MAFQSLSHRYGISLENLDELSGTHYLRHSRPISMLSLLPLPLGVRLLILLLLSSTLDLVSAQLDVNGCEVGYKPYNNICVRANSVQPGVMRTKKKYPTKLLRFLEAAIRRV